MRTSLVLLAVLAACSDSSGPHQIPVLTTQLSSSAESVSGTLEVTLNASNPTDTTLHVSSDGVMAEIKVGGQWQGGSGPYGDGFGAVTDTLSLTPGAAATLGTVPVTFSSVSASFNAESFSLSPGTYSVRACYFPTETVSPVGGIEHAVCGNSVELTLTP